MANEEVIKPGWATEIQASDKVVQNGEYTNLMLNTYKGHEGIAPGEFLTVAKHPEYAEPYTVEKEGQYGPYNMHRCTVVIDGTEASFVLFKDDEAAAFTAAGGVGESIQISKEKILYKTKKGDERARERLLFRPKPQ